MTRGNDKGKSFTVADETVSIGRDRSNSIRLDDDEVSRHHCSILVEDGVTFLVDENSSNGTFLNGSPVERSELKKGDRVRVGRTQFVFESFLQIELGPEHRGLRTVSPKRYQFSSSAETNPIDEINRSESVSLKLDTDDDSTYEKILSKRGQEEAQQQYIRVKNDLRFAYRASLATRTLDTPRMLHELMELIFEWVEADRGCVFLKNEQTQEFEARYVKLRQKSDNPNAKEVEESDRSTPLSIDQTIVDHVIKERVGVLSPKNDLTFRDQVDSPKYPSINEVICVPIDGRGELLGLFYVDNLAFGKAGMRSRFNTDHLRLMLAMAHQAAFAIENETLYRSRIKKERLSAIGEVTSMMSHRINNILQGLAGGSHLVQCGLDNEDLSLCQKGWEIAERNQQQVSQLVMDLVVLSQPYEPYKFDCDLADVVRKAIETVRHESSDLRCQFESDSRWEIFADGDAVQTAFESLIRVVFRGANQTEENLPFTIAIQKDDSFLQVQFQCCGFSIGKGLGELIPSLFDPDCPNDSETRIPKSNGSKNDQDGGLEFAVSRKIINGHGGSIKICEKSEWTQVHVNLPIGAGKNGS